MIQSKTVTLPRERGEIQNVHIVRGDSWGNVRFTEPAPAPEAAFSQLVDLYQNHHVAHYPWLYGQLVFFHFTDTIQIPGWEGQTDAATRLTLAAQVLMQGVTVKKGKPCFKTAEARTLYDALVAQHCIRVVCGKRKQTRILPVSDCCGFLSDEAPESGAVANLSFFLMDPYDCATPYDHLGVPVGLRVQDGKVLSIPQYNRPMLLVKKDGSVFITEDLRDCRIDPLKLWVDGREVTRLRERTNLFSLILPGKHTLTVSGERIVKQGQNRVEYIPTSGFCARLSPEETDADSALADDMLRLTGMEDILFGVQVGPVAVKDGKPQTGMPKHYFLISRLIHNVITLSAPHPPAMYRALPNRDRAPRMVLGADGDGKPILVWFEGAAKAHHCPGQDSCGATLKEAAECCASLGMVNGIHLDGGGSAQILINGKRLFKIADRDPVTGEERERAVPNGIVML